MNYDQTPDPALVGFRLKAVDEAARMLIKTLCKFPGGAP
jgi:hypothetical protein